jgi:hypothetical protein
MIIFDKMYPAVKISITFFAALLLCLTRLAAQETPMIINTEARLDNVLILRITPENYVQFAIRKINENLYQITEQPEDVMFSVESTGNWDLALNSTDAYFTGLKDSTHKIPVDFLGFFIENTGTNWDNGLFSNIANATKDTIVYLSDDKINLLESGTRGNIGGSTANSFVLRWKFFYEDDILRTRKFSDFEIEDDTYRVGYYVTLSESTGTKLDK